MQLKSNWPLPFTRYNVVEEEIGRLLNRQNLMENLPKSYLESVGQDLPRLINILTSISKIPGYTTDNFKYRTNDNLQFSAFTFLDLKRDPNFVTSIGLLMALDDMFFRLCTNADFFSHDFSHNLTKSGYGRSLWKGTNCIWLHGAGMSLPHTRFYDYRQQVRLERAFITDAGKVQFPTYLSAFYHVVPYEDNSRIELAALMVFIGLLFVLLHEEGHFWEGHLHFHSDKLLREAKIIEVQDSYEDEILNILSKVFEWQADRHASRGVIDVMLRKNAFPFQLPQYCQEPYWVLRAIMTVIGSINLIFERARTIYGSSKTYPSPRTRCMSVLLGCINRIQDSKIPFFHKFNVDEIFSAFIGSLYDLMVAADLFYHKEDLADFGPGNYSSPQTPQQMNFIEDEGEIFEVLNCIIQQLEPDVIVSQRVKRKWFGELEFIVDQHDNVVYEVLDTYRRMATGQ